MLSTTAEYALRIMVVLCEAGGDPRTSERVAALAHVPTDYSVKVLQMLARADLVRAQRGRGGGFRLACNPASTTLLDVITAIEPIERLARCPLGASIPPGPLCALHHAVDDALGLLLDRLSGTRLTDVAGDASRPGLCATRQSDPPRAEVVVTIPRDHARGERPRV